FPEHVDHQGRVRRVWPSHRPQKVLLSHSFYFLIFETNILFINCIKPL
ncbi:Hypothetical protein EIN_027230, partial [Entamoeba invadens IP1]